MPVIINHVCQLSLDFFCELRAFIQKGWCKIALKLWVQNFLVDVMVKHNELLSLPNTEFCEKWTSEGKPNEHGEYSLRPSIFLLDLLLLLFISELNVFVSVLLLQNSLFVSNSMGHFFLKNLKIFSGILKEQYNVKNKLHVNMNTK